MTVHEQLKKCIKAHPQGMKHLAEVTGVKYDVIRRMTYRDDYSPTLRHTQPLLDHFGLEIAPKNKRNGKTLK